MGESPLWDLHLNDYGNNNIHDKNDDGDEAIRGILGKSFIYSPRVVAPLKVSVIRAHGAWGMVWILYIQSLVWKTCPELVGVYLSIHLSLTSSPAPSPFPFLPLLPSSFSLSSPPPPPNFFCNWWHLFPVVSGPFRTSGMRQCDVSAFLRRVKQGEDRFISQRLHGLSNDQKAQWHPGSDALSVTDFSRFWPRVQKEAAAGPHCVGQIQEGTEPAS